MEAVSPATGRQAIHYAAEKGQEDLALWMARSGADVFAKDANGLSAVHLANPHLAKLLKGEIDSACTTLDKKNGHYDYA